MGTYRALTSEFAKELDLTVGGRRTIELALGLLDDHPERVPSRVITSCQLDQASAYTGVSPWAIESVIRYFGGRVQSALELPTEPGAMVRSDFSIWVLGQDNLWHSGNWNINSEGLVREGFEVIEP